MMSIHQVVQPRNRGSKQVVMGTSAPEAETDEPTMTEGVSSQGEAYARWGQKDSKLCHECLRWKHVDDFHLSLCQLCLDTIFHEVFINESRPLALVPGAAGSEHIRTDIPRPPEWPRKWYGKTFKDGTTEETLYKAYIAIIEGNEAFLAEVGETDIKSKRCVWLISKLQDKGLVRTKHGELDYT